jgi:hypothetical protein
MTQELNRYYRDNDGDYLVVNHATGDYYRQIGQEGMREARATAIAGNVMSVCTTSVDLGYLRTKCERVDKKTIPAKWLWALNGYRHERHEIKVLTSTAGLI